MKFDKSKVDHPCNLKAKVTKSGINSNIEIIGGLITELFLFALKLKSTDDYYTKVFVISI